MTAPTEVVAAWHTPPEAKDDLRMLGPVHECACGCNLFHTLVSFDQGEPSLWVLEGQCASCGTIVKLPCPIDIFGV